MRPVSQLRAPNTIETREDGLYQQVREAVDSDRGKNLHKKRRQANVEPVFDQIKFNRKIDRFLRRGHAADSHELTQMRLVVRRARRPA